MDYMFEIMALPKSKQAKAMKLLDQLREEFERLTPDYGKVSRLEYQLDEMLN